MNLTPKNHLTREILVQETPLRITSYQLGEHFVCAVDNMTPGATISRGRGATREDAESAALATAQKLLT